MDPKRPLGAGAVLFDSVLDAIGCTPVLRLRMDTPPGVDVYAKLEMQNVFAMKDRVARSIILKARESGVLRNGDPILESSSGTMALGVALVGTALGHPVHIVTDPRIDEVTLAKLAALGCEVHMVGAMTAQGWQSARLERLAELMDEMPGAFWPQQYTNPDNPAGYRRLAEELTDDLGRVDVLVGSVGSGGSLCGTARALRRRFPKLHVVGVDCVGSRLFEQPDRPERLQSGLGNSLLPGNLDRRLINEVHWLNDHEAFAATRALAAEQQLFAGNTSGVVYRVLHDVASRAEPGSTVVGIFPDRGDRYAGTVYSDAYWDRHRLSGGPVARTPQVVEYGTEVRTWSRAAVRPPSAPPRLLFVESNTTGSGMRALRTAAALGLEPVLLTGGPERYAGLTETGCEVVVCDTNSPEELRATVQRRYRREELAGVTSTSEFYIPRVADLAEWLGLPGNPPAAIASCRDKALLRETLAQAGVRQPAFGIAREGTLSGDVADAVARVGLPCVVKPVDDSGSRAVRLCHTMAEATEHAERILAERTNVRGQPTARRVLVEQYLPGPEVSVEMFGWDGETHCLGVTDKSTSTGPYFVEHQHVFPTALPTAAVDRIQDVVRRGLAAVGVGAGATHTEVKLTPEGPSVIEINPRPAGGMIPELMRLASGIRVLEQHMRVAAELPPQLTASSYRHAGIRFLTAPRPGVLRTVEGVAAAGRTPGVEQVTVTARPGAKVRPAQDAYDRLGFVIASGDAPGAVARSLAEAAARLRIRTDQDTTKAGPLP
ncbi:pyridoxal-phosphate dependent enzyme [Streptomyces litchfieldiae]|uniref:Pyridoxal-phosphate dependent enzyme n=1 Tax=Streptomyces litchfieldiae TaxID=3075543 RepID=A0ABU2MS66_9ACTN|nr:pyridoxal-phosphate dependent enzyme [Streptomyces sp. DSM 44938]MDT0343934.1 pyridoxal-phosphate dependent enzyme [Streptomyces sp. DSM 44938]